MTRNKEQRGKLSRVLAAIRENGPAITVAVIAFTGSFNHIVAVCEQYGMPWFEAYPVAAVVDLLCVMAAVERQRDKRIGRQRKGWVSWPTVIFCLGVSLTLAINEATARHVAWGYIVNAIAPVAMLLAVSLLERRASWQGSGNQNQSGREQSPAAAGTTVRKAVASSQNQAMPVTGTTAAPVPGTRGGGTLEPVAPAAVVQNRELSAATAGEQDGRKLTMDELVVLARRSIEEYAAANDGKRINLEMLGKELGVAKATAGMVRKEIDKRDGVSAEVGGGR